jgi:hypothetical protein
MSGIFKLSNSSTAGQDLPSLQDLESLKMALILNLSRFFFLTKFKKKLQKANYFTIIFVIFHKQMTYQ